VLISAGQVVYEPARHTHLILLEVLEIQFKRFGPETLGDAVNAAREDYKRTWFEEIADISG
jgi:hypothetical protein